jgi:hypothetical protein
MLRGHLFAALVWGGAAIAGAHAQEGAHAGAHAQEPVEVSAICIDVRGAPHPAAQTFMERDAPADFEGELFRCLAGTRLRYDADHAVRDCAPGEALWFGAGALSCRTASEQPREHDRDLLRRFGPGVKLVRLAQEAPLAPPPPRTAYPRYQ